MWFATTHSGTCGLNAETIIVVATLSAGAIAGIVIAELCLVLGSFGSKKG
jgi:hypothetical protein